MIVTSFILGIIWGFITYHISLSLKNKINNKKLLTEISSQFKEVLSNIKTDKSVFVSRVNQTVIVDTRLSKYDIVNIVYLMDKQIICIFKDNNCIYTSDSIESNLKNEILLEINTKFKEEINDVVDVMGLTISKEEFNSKIKEIKEIMKQNPDSLKIDIDDDKNELDNIIKENNLKFDVDQILDKISKHGIKSISLEERKFLDNLNK
jgi:hypothetical protein